MEAMRWVRLRTNKGRRIPRRIICIDTESDCPPDPGISRRAVHSFRLGCAIATDIDAAGHFRTTHSRFSNRHAMWQWILTHGSRKSRTWVFAHNAGFDLQVSGFFSLADCGDIAITRHVVADPPTIIDFKSYGRTFRVVDSMNYLPAGLAKIGEFMGMEKYPMPHRTESDSRWYEYCERDVQILHAFVMALLNTVEVCNLGNFQPTIASQSYSAFRHRWMHDSIYSHGDPGVRTIEREAYRGGRVYCWKDGKIEMPAIKVDCNNLYPFVMSNEKYPVQLADKGSDISPAELLRSLDTFGAVAEVSLETSANQYPLKMPPRIIYPSGRYMTTLAGPELLRALRGREVNSVGRYALYEMCPIFAHWGIDWLEYLYRAKKSGDVLGYKFGKLFANSLSGKFAQRKKVWERVSNALCEKEWGEWSEHDVDSGISWQYRAIGGCVQREIDYQEQIGACPAISAYITSYGRLHMDALREQLPPWLIYYQDTDAFICHASAEQYVNSLGLLSDCIPGKFKVERRYFSLEIDGLRRIREDGELHMPGLKPHASEVGDGTFLQDNWQGLRRIAENGPVDTVTVVRSKLRPQEKYLGAVRDENGWTRPITLN